MQSIILPNLQHQKQPIEVIVVGLGFMGFGFVSLTKHTPGIVVPLVISRRPSETLAFLEKEGYVAKIESNPSVIKDNLQKGIISVSDDMDLIKAYENQIVFEMTGTVDYGTEVALKTLEAKKNLVTMNPELQATVGTPLKRLFDQQNLVITDVVGDQPGSLARLIASSKDKGFKTLLAGNMKRYLDRHATQKKMQPWADDKGLAVRQTVSFTDGTKQAIEMTLVSNYFGMSILEAGMKGPVVERFDQVLTMFDWESVPENGVVDYMLGRSLFPGVFIVVEHIDPHQQKYLRYLGLGDGPRYVLFDSYHLCHLEVSETLAKVGLYHTETINNGLNPTTTTVAMAKFDLQKGQVLDGIGGDTLYGSIRTLPFNRNYLPVGISQGAVLKRDVPQDTPIGLDDVELVNNAATRLLELV